MRTFANVFSRYRFAVLAALISVSVVCLFVRPNIAYAAGVDDETKFVFNTFSFLIWGALGHVDVRGLHHARIGLGAYKERLHHLLEEHRHLLNSRHCVLRYRL